MRSLLAGSPAPPRRLRDRRLSLALVIALGSGLWAGAARAQMAATCSGMLGNQQVTGTIYLNVPVTGDKIVRVDPSKNDGNAGGVFNRAECECKTAGASGVQMAVIMSAPIPLSVTGQGLTMWLGTGADCTDSTNQNNSCFQLNPAPKELSLASFQSTAEFTIPLPADLLTDPLGVPKGGPRSCESKMQTSIVNILIGASANPVPVTCKLSVPINTIAPIISNPGGVTIGAGDGALTVNFPTEMSGARSYQVLCREKGATTPVASLSERYSATPFYSTCVNGAIKRRIEVPGSAASGGTSDGGVTTTDGGFLTQGPTPSNRIGKRGGWTPQDTGDMATPDLAPVTDPFLLLDPSFLCSERVTGGGTTATTRIDGLENDHDYEVLVVAIDVFGNATPYSVQTGRPRPAQNLGEALGKDAQGNGYLGFRCQAAPGGARPKAPVGLALLALVGLSLGARRRRPGARA